MVCSLRGNLSLSLFKPMAKITTWNATRASLSAWNNVFNTYNTWIGKAKFTDADVDQNIELDALPSAGFARAINKNALKSPVQDDLVIESGAEYDLLYGLKSQALLSNGIGFSTHDFERGDLSGGLIRRTGSYGVAGEGLINEKTTLLKDKAEGLDSNPGDDPGYDADTGTYSNGCHRNYFNREEPLADRFESSWDENYKPSNENDDIFNDLRFPAPSSDGDDNAPEPTPNTDTDGGGMTDPDDPMSVDPSPSEDDPEDEDGSQGGMSDPDAPICEETGTSDEVDQSSDNPMNDHQGDGGSTPEFDSPDSDINWGPDSQNGEADSASVGFADQHDPITNWGPNGKPTDAGYGLDIGIGVRDPHTNWGDENHVEHFRPSNLINVLGDIKPDFNEHYVGSLNLVDSMAVVGSDLF